jgi:hypothetical protein
MLWLLMTGALGTCLLDTTHSSSDSSGTLQTDLEVQMRYEAESVGLVATVRWPKDQRYVRLRALRGGTGLAAI